MTIEELLTYEQTKQNETKTLFRGLDAIWLGNGQGLH